MKPDEKIFSDHLGNVDFQLGLENYDWGIDEIERDWPNKIIWIKSHIKINGTEKIYLFFNLENYPEQAPTSYPWDILKDTKLIASEWPKGNPSINSAFNAGWKSGSALYIPCDRIAMQGHENWKQNHPDIWWTSDKTITHYLKTVFRLLN